MTEQINPTPETLEETAAAPEDTEERTDDLPPVEEEIPAQEADNTSEETEPEDERWTVNPQLEAFLDRLSRRLRRLELQDNNRKMEEFSRYRLRRKAAQPTAFFRGVGAALVGLPVLLLSIRLMDYILDWLRWKLGIDPTLFYLGLMLFAAGILIIAFSGSLGKSYVNMTDVEDDEFD